MFLNFFDIMDRYKLQVPHDPLVIQKPWFDAEKCVNIHSFDDWKTTSNDMDLLLVQGANLGSFHCTNKVGFNDTRSDPAVQMSVS